MPYSTAPDGAQTFYKDWGAGQPVVFSHGWPLNADAWDVEMKLVADHGFRAIAHDRRGHGRSSQTWDGNDMDTYAADLAALIAALDLDDVILVGHSTGGGEVVRYAARHGAGRVAKIVTAGAVPPIMVKSESNPEGTPIEAFDEIGPEFSPTARSSTGTCLHRSSEPTGKARRFPKASAISSGGSGCKSGSRAPTTASEPSRRPTSPRTSKRSGLRC